MRRPTRWPTGALMASARAGGWGAGQRICPGWSYRASSDRGRRFIRLPENGSRPTALLARESGWQDRGSRIASPGKKRIGRPVGRYLSSARHGSCRAHSWLPGRLPAVVRGWGSTYLRPRAVGVLGGFLGGWIQCALQKTRHRRAGYSAPRRRASCHTSAATTACALWGLVGSGLPSGRGGLCPPPLAWLRRLTSRNSPFHKRSAHGMHARLVYECSRSSPACRIWPTYSYT